jgi:hypothetical protein
MPTSRDPWEPSNAFKVLMFHPHTRRGGGVKAKAPPSLGVSFSLALLGLIINFPFPHESMRRIFLLYFYNRMQRKAPIAAEIALFLSTLFHSTGDLVETLIYSPHGKIINS